MHTTDNGAGGHAASVSFDLGTGTLTIGDSGEVTKAAVNAEIGLSTPATDE